MKLVQGNSETSSSVIHSHYRHPKKRRQQERDRKLFEEIIAENIPNDGKETDIQVQEAPRVPNKINPKKSTASPYHIIIKMSKTKDKERILKAVRKRKQLHTREIP